MSSRILQAIQSTWIRIGVALLILTLLEGVARVGSGIRQRDQFTAEHEEVERLLRANASTGADWTRDYVRELAESFQAEWHPYVYWRMKPYRGKYINVDKSGIRHTWNSAAAPSQDQLRVFMFGGSTLWGVGARDDFTIPSLVSKKLSDAVGTGAWVTNFGEVGYVSTQEVIALMLELQRGNIPDIVIFYDGVNDAIAALQNGVAGVPQNEQNRVTEFDLRRNSGSLLDLQPIILRRLALYRLSRLAVRSFRSLRFGNLPGEDATPAEPLANGVIDVYLRNVRLVDSLGSRFGFKAVFFWQPTAFSKRVLTQEERGLLERRLIRIGGLQGSRLAPFFGQVSKAFEERLNGRKIENGNVYDLSAVLDGEVGTVFMDPFHVMESGNDRIAAAMVRALQRAALLAKR